MKTNKSFSKIKLWSGKWCIKDEHKLLSDLGTTTNGGSAYYDTHNGFPSSTGSESILYDSITTISQAQSSLYTPPIGKFQVEKFV